MTDETDLRSIAAHLGEAAPIPDEDAVIDQIIAANEMMLPSGARRGERAQHPKAHGTARARLEVLALGPGDADLAHGLWAAPAVHEDVLVRFSNGGKTEDNDAEGDAHGMAIKIRGVAGDRWLDAGPEGEANLVLVDSETFFDGDLKRYAIFNDLVGEIAREARGGGGRVAAGLNKVWLGLLRPLAKGDLLSPALAFSDQRPVSPLRTPYWSATPYRCGPDRAVKYLAVPDPANAAPASPAALDPDDAGQRDALGARLAAGLAEGAQRFDLWLEVQASPDLHPVEDPTVAWSARGVRRVRVAVLTLHAMAAEDWAAAKGAGEALSFNPGVVPLANRPLGAVNRARGKIYQRLFVARRERAGG